MNVALRNGHRIEVAACADPLGGEVFWTDGHDACRRRDGSDEALSVLKTGTSDGTGTSTLTDLITTLPANQ